MNTLPEIQTSLACQKNEQEVLQLSPNSLAMNLGRKALHIVESMVALEGTVHEVMGLEVNSKLFNRFQMVEGIRRSGEWRSHYSEYLDKRVISVDEQGDFITGEIIKVRTCYMRENIYDPKMTGSHSQRTALGSVLTQTGLDELPQILDKDEHSFRFELVGTRPRKIQDFYYVPEFLKQRDIQVYNSLPFGVIDPHAPDRKKSTKNNMAERSAYGIAYANAINDNPDSKLLIDSAIVRTAVQELVPAKSRATKAVIKCLLSKLIDGYEPLSHYQSQIVYDEHIRQPANAILSDIS